MNISLLYIQLSHSELIHDKTFMVSDQILEPTINKMVWGWHALVSYRYFDILYSCKLYQIFMKLSYKIPEDIWGQTERGTKKDYLIRRTYIVQYNAADHVFLQSCSCCNQFRMSSLLGYEDFYLTFNQWLILSRYL